MLVSVRGADGASANDLEWARVSVERLGDALPWRTFRWHKGQKHFPGFYWSATMADHVIYESRLELARLLYADFDQTVKSIVAQPFLLKARVDGQTRRHVPDFLPGKGRRPGGGRRKAEGSLCKERSRSLWDGPGPRSRPGAGSTRSGPSRPRRRRRTCGCSPGTAGTGFSTADCSTR